MKNFTSQNIKTSSEVKTSILVMEDEDLNFVWENICSLQLIFHPYYSKEGSFDYKVLSDIKSRKKIYLILDGNLLSSLLKLSRDGILKDENEMLIVGLLMTWAIMNNFLVSPGLALMEHATKSMVR